MEREIEAVHTRCRDCGTATWLLVRTTGLSDDGSQYVTIMAEPVPHDAADCKRMKALERETWPTLW